MRALALLLALAAPATAETSPERLDARDGSYAGLVFEGVVPVERVEASRRWHPLFDGRDLACTFAVVTLGPGAPAEPPSRGTWQDDWPFNFGGDWRPTPILPAGEMQWDTLAECEREWDAPLAARIRAAASEPGSWVVGAGGDEEVHLYSLPQRLAARIRYGD